MKLVKTTVLTPEEFCRRMGAELRRIREDAGLSRQQLGERTGIHRNSIERYERGADVPIMTFVRLCVAAGASCAEILDRIGVTR
jgi:transcriptional regulator with XRE-family HTH domain